MYLCVEPSLHASAPTASEPLFPPLSFAGHVQLLRQASGTGNVIFATYSMEESRKAQAGESKRFVDALITFSGDTSATDAREQPRIFKYDISKEVEELELCATGTSSQSAFLQVLHLQHPALMNMKAWFSTTIEC